ncbi:MAG: phosphopeptide-binding protein, partial [Microbacterium sp.]|nr:phosphopeptide-binding protein [Microbacterium sp.]
NGTKVSEAPLPPDATVSIGRTDIVFRIVAQAAGTARPPRNDDATRAFSLDEREKWGESHS